MTFEAKITPWQRIGALKERIERRGFVRLIEAHNGISGLVGETVTVEKDGEQVGFDGFWESSLTDSASKGLPDVELIGSESRLHTIDEIFAVTTKPMVVDGDTGGDPDGFRYLVTQLERRGVSAVIIEDKIFPKRNSLDPTADQVLEIPSVFGEKIAAGKDAQVTSEFMIIARLESLIAGRSLEDALERAEVYVNAGADGVMIHSRSTSGEDIIAFAKAFPSPELCERLGRRPLMVSVPTNYNSITDTELADAGFNMVIHANHLMRSALGSMRTISESILSNDRSFEADDICSPVRDLFNIVGYERIQARDKERAESNLPTESVIIPAAGRDPKFPESPKSLIQISGKSLIDHQLEAVGKLGLKNIVVVKGHEGQQFDGMDLTTVKNDKYEERHSLYSLLRAREHMAGGFVMVYSDILFSPDVLQKLMSTDKDIVLAIDSSYQYHKHEIDKKLDLIRAGSSGRRSLSTTEITEVLAVGKNLESSDNNQEFIGMAYFSDQGARRLLEIYDASTAKHQTPFHEAESIERAAVTDMIQELIDQNIPVYGREIQRGWIEVHNRDDVKAAELEITNALQTI